MTSTGPTHKLTTTRKGGALDTLNCATTHALQSAPACTIAFTSFSTRVAPPSRFSTGLWPPVYRIQIQACAVEVQIFGGAKRCVFCWQKQTIAAATRTIVCPAKQFASACGFTSSGSLPKLCTDICAEIQSAPPLLHKGKAGRESLAGTAVQSQCSGPSRCASVYGDVCAFCPRRCVRTD